MKKLNLYLKRTDSIGLLHDSRKDVRLLSDCINKISAKVDELIDENDRLKKEIETIKNRPETLI